MPAHKRQHYVPRCYLKPFSRDGSGAAINLFNVGRQKAISAAPVKGQCAKDYFYGADLKLEKALQNIEGKYSSLQHQLTADASSLTSDELLFLLEFSYLQLRRTDMAIQRLRIAHAGLHKAVFEGREIEPEEIDLSDRALMHDSMEIFFDTRHLVGDLKVCLLKNDTEMDFITSDDPTIFTNRFYMQRLGISDFGAASSGVLYILPLSPRFSLIGYDGLVYTFPDKQGHLVSLQKVSDVVSLNELQYLKAAENIYFSNWADAERHASEFRVMAPRRPESWQEIIILVKAGEDDRGIVYRRAKEEEKDADQVLLQLSARHPQPSIWLTKLKFRSPPRTHSNGTGVGHVRKKEWLTRDP